MRTETASTRGLLGGFKGLRRTYLYLKRANRKRVLLLLSAAFLMMVILGLFVTMLVIDATQQGKIFPGVTINGLPVGGMSVEDARSHLSGMLVSPISEPLVMYYDDEEFTLDLSRIDLHVDVDAMVGRAYFAGMGTNILERMARRFLNRPLEVDIPLVMSYEEEQLDDFVVEIARELNHPAKNASIDMTEGRPLISHSQDGLEVKQKETLESIIAALPTGNRRLPVVTRKVEPEVSDSDIEYIVVIKQAEHTLYLYHLETLEGTFPVALGSPEYPTPNGKFYIIKKEKDPTWYPPKSEWAKDEEPIPPGPGNPLGPYWMAIGDGIGIHSTPDAASLGYSVSHGCIRMSEWGAQQLFDRVEVGTPVYIIPAPKPPPEAVTPPSEEPADQAPDDSSPDDSSPRDSAPGDSSPGSAGQSKGRWQNGSPRP